MRLRIAVICLAVLAVALWASWDFVLGSEHSQKAVTIYDPDPVHVWNRLHAEIFIREDLPGSEKVPDSLDPPLFYHTRYLLEKPSHRRALHILDEFLKTHAENLIHDPVKRAILQRDLWAAFDWTVERGHGYPTSPDYDQERRELQTRFAEVLGRLALTSEAVESLPDNYAQAVASGEFDKEYDAAHRDRAFLPPDLFEPQGSWVELEGPGDPEPVAEQHFRQFSGRSSFFVFLRLPGGRKATFEYLKNLWDFPRPVIPRPDQTDQMIFNPDLPQFPAETQVALVRQMTLFDNQGKLANAPITESVQIRVYRSVAQSNAPTVGVDQRITKSGQDFYEIKLSRPQLFANKAGGLRAVERDEKEFAIFGFAGPDEGRPGHYASLDQYGPVLKRCVMCHAYAGIHSLNSRSRLLKPHGLQRDLTPEAYGPRWWRDARTQPWKQNHEDWALLSGYWKASR